MTRAGQMADHLMTQTLPTTQADLAAYYQQGMEGAGRGVTAPEPRRDMNPAVAEKIGIDQNKPLGRDEIANLLQGRRGDGKPIEGKSTTKATENKSRNGYVDLCWSADKSVSIAWAMAPTEAERNVIMQAHRDAVDSAMAYVEKQLAYARKGSGGKHGEDKGHLGWIKFDHYTSRSTIAVRKNEHGEKKLTLAHDNEAREGNIEFIDLKVPGDMNLHTHVAVPNMVLTDDGRVRSIDFNKLQDRIHEFGAVYQAFIATNLKRAGIDVVEKDGAARVTAIPERVRDAFSKRTRDAHEMARDHAIKLGADWDNMNESAKISLLKRGAKGSRQTKTDDLSDMDAWRKQAADLKWEPKSVIQNREFEIEPSERRFDKAYHHGLPFLEDAFSRRSVLPASEARRAVARGFISTTIDSDEDINAVTSLMRERGVRQDGKQTELVWGQSGDTGKKWFLTTGLHIGQEKELIRLVKDAANDKALSLTHDEIDAAAKRTDLDFNSEHGRNQRNLMERLGTGGKVAIGIGIAGSGKSAVLRPLVDAWHEKGLKVYGAALAWQQSEALTGAGIDKNDAKALSVFLWRANKGHLTLDAKTVVVVDELGQIGARQMLDMMRLQKKHGFKLVAVGDDRQCQAIEAGPVIELMRKALGKDTVPELLTTIRQEHERERKISTLFRDGKAEEALKLKNEDGTVILEPGGHKDAVQRVAELWDERRKANRDNPSFKISVSAPTNADAREISAALREKRRAAGELSEDKIVIAAQDQHKNPAFYDLKLAIGDRVRLFDRVNASFGDRGGVIGSNGSVLEILAVDKHSVTLRAETGIEGRVKWETLRDKKTGRIRLTYGDAGTIDSQQGITSTEHIDALPSGSKSVQGFKAYVAESRHRRKSWMVTSDGAERQEVVDRRPLGDGRVISDKDIWENMSRNLSRQPEKLAAVDFLGRANNLRRTALHGMQSGLQRKEQREFEGKPPTTLGEAVVQAQEATIAPWIVDAIDQTSEVLEQHTKNVEAFEDRLKAFEKAMASVEKHVEDISAEHLLEAMGATGQGELPDAPDWADGEKQTSASTANRKYLRTPGRPKREQIPKEHIEALKETVRISDLISQSVKLDRAGHDFKACCPFHDERTPSFHVSDKKGTFTCYGCGEHGDALDWLKAQHGLKFHDAIKYLEDRSGITLPNAINVPRAAAAQKEPEWKAVPVPHDAPPLIQPSGKTARIYNPKREGTDKEWGSYRPAHVASYRDSDGKQIGYVIRVEIKDENASKDRKFTPQVTWVVPADAAKDADPVKVGRWALHPMPDPRPLYHAEMLAKHPDVPVIVVTGEKKADALQAVMGDDAVVVSWAGGDNARQFVDFKPLTDRDVIVWPDADQSGIDAALGKMDKGGSIREGAAKMVDDVGATKVRVLMPPDESPKGWDCGDFVKEGASKTDVQKLISERARDRLELEQGHHIEHEDNSIGL